jgi:hypothetical protein
MATSWSRKVLRGSGGLICRSGYRERIRSSSENSWGCQSIMNNNSGGEFPNEAGRIKQWYE